MSYSNVLQMLLRRVIMCFRCCFGLNVCVCVCVCEGGCLKELIGQDNMSAVQCNFSGALCNTKSIAHILFVR